MANTDLPFEASPSEIQRRLDGGEQLRLIDVREPAEHAIANILGATLIPMQTVPQALQQLEAEDGTLIVFCHHGVRSLSVVDWLRRQGVDNCQSMSGGIDLWSLQVDRTVPRY